MSASYEYEITLKERQHAYLKEMAQKYKLGDESKALRCLIDYALEKQAEESAIFQQIRCLDC